MKPFNIYLTGVGGQGIGLLIEILLRAADHAGFPVKGVDTHGLAQRGGIVVSQIRIGEEAHSPLIRQGEADLVVALETELTEDLVLEGLARELVHRIQNMRRSAGFEIADHINTYYQGDGELDEVVAGHGDYVRQETLSREVVKGGPPEGAYTETHTINGVEVVLAVERE